MKRTVLIAVALVLALGFQAPHRTDFSGNWKLDQKKSKNLPPSFRSVEKYVLTVTQTADTLVAVAAMTGSGQSVTLPPMIFPFDGKESYLNDSLRGVQRWTSSEWETTGSKLIVHKRSIQKMQGREEHTTQTDIWQLKNPTTLLVTVSQKIGDGDSTHSEQRVYHRVK